MRLVKKALPRNILDKVRESNPTVSIVKDSHLTDKKKAELLLGNGGPETNSVQVVR